MKNTRTKLHKKKANTKMNHCSIKGLSWKVRRLAIKSTVTAKNANRNANNDTSTKGNNKTTNGNEADFKRSHLFEI
jgi:hypothetical protein